MLTLMCYLIYLTHFCVDVHIYIKPLSAFQKEQKKKKESIFDYPLFSNLFI